MRLHSNPGPTQVFVDPANGRFRGLIDFGDSYLRHPALYLVAALGLTTYR